MPKLSSFYVEIKTGENGRDDQPTFVINGFELPFDQPEGSCGPGETFTATGNPASFAHSLHLIGPKDGDWDVDELKITYFGEGDEPYSFRFKPFTLTSDTNANIWRAKPAPAFDV